MKKTKLYFNKPVYLGMSILDLSKSLMYSYEVQPPSELLAYLKPPIFYNSERIQQNCEMFCGHLRLFALKQLSLGNNVQAVINYLI